MFLEQIKKSSDRIFKYLLFCGGFLGFMALNIIMSKDISTQDILEQSIQRLGELFTFTYLLFPFTILLAILLVWVKWVHNQSITSLLTSRSSLDFHRIFFAFGVWSSVLIVMTLVSYLVDPSSFTFQFDAKQFLYLCLIAVILVPLQTSFEEIFFRGYFMQGLFMTTQRRWIALVVTSVIFGLMHLSNPEVETYGLEIMWVYIGSGFFLGLLTLLDEGLELALGYHAANNLIGCLLLTSEDAVFQTPALLKFQGATNMWENYIQVFVIFPILMIIFSRKFGFSISLKKII